jgi:hypothetical protein
VKLQTTRNTYLTIQGIQIWGGSIGGSTTTTTSSTATTQVTKWGAASQSSTYSGRFAANQALTGKGTAITKNGVGQWWSVRFSRFRVTKIKVQNRRDCCGERLAFTDVFVGGSKCG